MLVRVWEMQKRGVLHAHPVLAYSTLGERLAADRYMTLLAELAPLYGFGYVERKKQVREPQRAAAYLSSYFVTGRKGKEALQESVMARQMPRSIIHVSKDLTQASGVTMRSLRHKRYLYRIWGDSALRFVLNAGFTLAELVRADRAGIGSGQLMRGYVQANAP